MKAATVPNYATLDADRPWEHKEAWMADVEAMGFEYITEMVHKTYKRLGTINKTAKELGISTNEVGQVLHHVGAKVAPRGGRNNTVLNPGLVRALRIGWDEVGTKNGYVERFMVDNNLKCHPDTVKLALDGGTWGCV